MNIIFYFTKDSFSFSKLLSTYIYKGDIFQHILTSGLLVLISSQRKILKGQEVQHYFLLNTLHSTRTSWMVLMRGK